MLYWRMKESQMDGFRIIKWEDGKYCEGNFQKGI